MSGQHQIMNTIGLTVTQPRRKEIKIWIWILIFWSRRRRWWMLLLQEAGTRKERLQKL